MGEVLPALVHAVATSSGSVMSILRRERPPCTANIGVLRTNTVARGTGLLVLREAEFDAAVAGVEPAAGDGLAAGEEVHAFGAVGVAVAEQ